MNRTTFLIIMGVLIALSVSAKVSSCQEHRTMDDAGRQQISEFQEKWRMEGSVPTFGFISGVLIAISISIASFQHSNNSFVFLTEGDPINKLKIRGFEKYANDHAQVLFYSVNCSMCKRQIVDMLEPDRHGSSNVIFVSIDKESEMEDFYGPKVLWTNTDQKILGLGELPACFRVENGLLRRTNYK